MFHIYTCTYTKLITSTKIRSRTTGLNKSKCSNENKNYK